MAYVLSHETFLFKFDNLLLKSDKGILQLKQFLYVEKGQSYSFSKTLQWQYHNQKKSLNNVLAFHVKQTSNICENFNMNGFFSLTTDKMIYTTIAVSKICCIEK